jgi:hypothetical protein
MIEIKYSIRFATLNTIFIILWLLVANFIEYFIFVIPFLEIIYLMYFIKFIVKGRPPV